jgi:hypothetical protein
MYAHPASEHIDQITCPRGISPENHARVCEDVETASSGDFEMSVAVRTGRNHLLYGNAFSGAHCPRLLIT